MTEAAAVPPRIAPDFCTLETALRSRLAGGVRFDVGNRAAFSADASSYRQAQIGVVIPQSIEDVVATAAVCRDHVAPILPRGRGILQRGQCVVGVNGDSCREQIAQCTERRGLHVAEIVRCALRRSAGPN